MALAQDIQLQDGAGVRGRARRLAGSPVPRVVGRRPLAGVVVLWGVTFLTYVVMGALPNDTAQALAGLNATPAEVAALNRKLGLNRPFWVRYGHWLWAALHGNLGTDVDGASVNSQIAQHIPVTLELLAYALVVSLVLALLV